MTTLFDSHDASRIDSHVRSPMGVKNKKGAQVTATLVITDESNIYGPTGDPDVQPQDLNAYRGTLAEKLQDRPNERIIGKPVVMQVRFIDGEFKDIGQIPRDLFIHQLVQRPPLLFEYKVALRESAQSNANSNSDIVATTINSLSLVLDASSSIGTNAELLRPNLDDFINWIFFDPPFGWDPLVDPPLPIALPRQIGFRLFLARNVTVRESLFDRERWTQALALALEAA